MTNKEIISSWIQTFVNDNPSSLLMCEGIKDGFYGTIPNISQITNPERLIELPISEAASIGMAIGASQFGLKPIVCFQRVEFGILALDQLITNGSKIGRLTGNKFPCSLLLRMVIGRGWGQGPLHSQSFESIWNCIPGLKVFMPSSAEDYLESFEYFKNNTGVVISLEHRWTHMINQSSFGTLSVLPPNVPPLITVYSYSFNSAIVARVKKKLQEYNIEIECIHENTFLSKYRSIKASVARTNRLITIDIGASRLGLGGEVVAKLIEDNSIPTNFRFCRLGTPWEIAPAQPELAKNYFPNELMLYEAIQSMLPSEYTQSIELVISKVKADSKSPCDVPDRSFNGPF